MIPARTMRDSARKPSLASIADQAGRSQRRTRGHPGCFLMMFFLYTGHAAIWSVPRADRPWSAALQPQQIGLLIGISLMVWGLFRVRASRACWLCGSARVWPQVISLGISIVAAGPRWCFTHSALGFGVTSALVALSWFYGLPYQMGLLAAYDPRGKANLAGSLMTTSGAAAGPAIAARLAWLWQLSHHRSTRWDMLFHSSSTGAPSCSAPGQAVAADARSCLDCCSISARSAVTRTAAALRIGAYPARANSTPRIP